MVLLNGVKPVGKCAEMPAKSPAQKRLMDAAAHNPAFAKKVGVPAKVAKEFSSASKGQTFKQGGDMKESKAMVKKEISFMKNKGAPKSMVKHEMGEMAMKKMAKGGSASSRADGIATKGKTKGKMLAKGGKAC